MKKKNKEYHTYTHTQIHTHLLGTECKFKANNNLGKQRLVSTAMAAAATAAAPAVQFSWLNVIGEQSG